MSDYGVGVDLSLNGADTYQTGMGQAIALTEQYNKVAGGTAGRITDMTTGMVGLTAKVVGFNKVQSVALDTAAGYQKMLENVEATTKTTGGNFEKLAKVTKGFARDFPVGMGVAVKTMSDLQSLGIKNEKQLEKLGKSFIKFEAVTGASAKEFTQLSKAMGNGTQSFDKMSDSLTTVTARIGGSAPSIVAFSKALAPVAASVGMSQTAVMGLSASMSALGEDGYRAANTFNKVILDMNRSVRDGGPELKAYAQLMGRTNQEMKDLLKSNPAEFLQQFTEAVGKGGPDVQRLMESLGFDSVRDQRSLMALANAGGPRKAIEESVNAYGNGSTAKAAEAMFDGVVDSAEKLKETMTQTIVNISQPMLGFAKGMLNTMGAVSELSEKVTGSEVGQGVAKVAGTGSLVGGAAMTGLNVLTAYSMARWGGRKIRESERWKTGRETYRLGATGAPAPANMGLAREAMYALGASSYNPAGPPTNVREVLARGGARVGRGSMDAALRAASMLFLSPLAMGNNQPTLKSPAGDAFAKRMDDIKQMREQQNSLRNMPAGPLGAPTNSEINKAKVGAGWRMMTSLGGDERMRVRDVAGFGAKQVGMAGAALGHQAIVRPLMAGAQFMGNHPALMGIAAGAGLGYMAYSSVQKGRENLENLSAGKEDIYSSFNNLAEAIGKAGKGIVDFAQTIEESASKVRSKNTSIEEALDLTEEEVTTASSPGYERKMHFDGDTASLTKESIAAQIVAQLGTSAPAEMYAQAATDVVSQFGQAKAEDVLALVKPVVGSEGTGELDYETITKAIMANRSSSKWDEALGMNEAQGNLGRQGMQFAMRTATEKSESFGGTYAETGVDAQTAAILVEADRWVKQAKEAGLVVPGENSSATRAVNVSLMEMLGLSEDEALQSGLGAAAGSPGWAVQEEGDIEGILRRITDSGVENARVDAALKLFDAGWDPDKPQWGMFGGKANGIETDARKAGADLRELAISAGLVDGRFGSLAKSMHETDRIARETGALTSEQGSADRAGLSSQDAMVAKYLQDPTDKTAKRLAPEAMARKSMEGVQDDNYDFGMMNLLMSQAQYAPGSTQHSLQGAAAERLAIRQRVATSGTMPQAQWMQQMRLGQIVATQAPMSGAAGDVQQSYMDQGLQGEANTRNYLGGLFSGIGSVNLQAMQTQRMAGIQAGAISRDAALREEWATDDYKTQRGYQREDYRTSRSRGNRDFTRSRDRAERDFNRSEMYGEQDFNTSKGRAERDFGKQQARQEEDYNKSRTRATEDFEKSKYRATRDYNLQIARANRDFQTSQARGEEDYNKSRTRTMQDYAKQVKRMMEDAAKQMYDPFKRMQVEMVMDAGQLVANLNEQSTAIEKQKQTLEELRALGMTDDTIKALGLADANKAQQAARLLGDAQGNAALIGDMNSAVSRKASAAETLTKDSGNTQFARMEEDMATSLARGEEDYLTSKARATEDFTRSMADAALDFETAMADMQVDFDTTMARGKDDFKTNTARQVEDFATAMADMTADYEKGRQRNRETFAQQMDDMLEDHRISLADAHEDFVKMMNRQEAAFEKSIERMQIQTANSLATLGASTAAQVKSMYEQLVGTMSQTFSQGITTVDMAQTVVGQLLGLGITPEQWSPALHAVLAGLGVSAKGELVTQGTTTLGPGAKEYWGNITKPANVPTRENLVTTLSSTMNPALLQYFRGPQGANASISDYAKTAWGKIDDPQNFPTSTSIKNKLEKALGLNVSEEGSSTAMGVLRKLATVPAGEDNDTVAGVSKKAWAGLKEGFPEASALTKLMLLSTGLPAAAGGPPVTGSVWHRLAQLAGTDEGSVHKAAVAAWSNLNDGVPNGEQTKDKWKPWADMQASVIRHLRNQWDKYDITFGVPAELSRALNEAGYPQYATDWQMLTSPKPGTIDFFAEGGIATRPTLGMVAEAGSSEAMIPLNQRGADFLAATMARYLDNTEVRGAQAASYSTPVTQNYEVVQDYRTQFTGDITVEAQDPDEMAHKLAAKRRRQRLAQPIGGRR